MDVMMRVLVVLFVINVLFPINNAFSQDIEVINIAIGESYKGENKTTKYGMTVEGVITSVYKGAGIPYTVTYLPDERAIQSIITGQYDALDLRIGQLDNEAGLVKVNVPLEQIKVHLFAKDGSYYQTLDDAKDKIIVTMHGTRYIEVLKDYRRLHRVYSVDQAALMLMAGRADVWLAPLQSYAFLSQQYPDIKIASPPVDTEDLYHYIRLTKSHLLQPLEDSAREFVRLHSEQAE